jgi:hypothetical protein
MSCRKNQATLTAAEKQAFVNALLHLKNSTPSQLGLGNRYDDYVQMHMNAMMLMNGQNRVPGWAHRAPAFFAWHRVMLRQLELDLQKIDPTVSLPYWDWTVDRTPGASLWAADFLGGDGTGSGGKVMTGAFAADNGQWPMSVVEAGATNYLQREFAVNASDLPTASDLTGALGETPFDGSPWGQGDNPSFRDRAEGWHGLGSIHNRVHLWVGGSMLPSTSPNDPVFFLHHCNIDRLLSLWQRQHPVEGYHPTGSGGETGPLGHNLNDVLIFNDQGEPNPFAAAFPLAGTLNHHAMGYWYDTDPPEVNLLTPSLSFTDIPEGIGGTGVTTYRAVVFEVLSCDPVTLQITAGPTAPFTAPLGLDTIVVPSSFDEPAHGRLWIGYTSTTAGSSATGSVTVHVVETNQTWVINIGANTVARPKSAVALVLDHSGSMSDEAGDGQPKVSKLKEAVQAFTDVMLPGDGLAIVRFDDTAQTLIGVTDVGPVTPVTPGSGRDQAQQILAGNQLDPAGATSIGGGLSDGRNALDNAPATVPPYTVKGLVVLTDGMENTAPYIADVAGSINANTYAIGFGTPANISVAALNALTQNQNGYLVVTGVITQDIKFRLVKYFLQILAGITNAQVVLDPQGELIVGATHRIPFWLSEADFGADVILLCPAPYIVDFALETPGGALIKPTIAEPSVQFAMKTALSYYRMSLPALAGLPGGSHRGQWHAVLSLGKRAQRGDRELASSVSQRRTLPYSLLVHGYSNLNFEATIQQSTFDPGSLVRVHARLTEYDVPVEQRARVRAEIVRPDGSTFLIVLTEQDAGKFSAEWVADETGLYTARIRATGTTFYGAAFQREQTLTAVTIRSGNEGGGRGGGSGDSGVCATLECLIKEGLRSPRLREWARNAGLDLEALLRCLREGCGASYLATWEARIRHAMADIPREHKTAMKSSGKKSDRTQPLAELVKGRPVDRTVRGEKAHGPMFDFSPEDKAAGRGAPKAQKPGKKAKADVRKKRVQRSKQTSSSRRRRPK